MDQYASQEYVSGRWGVGIPQFCYLLTIHLGPQLGPHPEHPKHCPGPPGQEAWVLCRHTSASLSLNKHPPWVPLAVEHWAGLRGLSHGLCSTVGTSLTLQM